MFANAVWRSNSILLDFVFSWCNSKCKQMIPLIVHNDESMIGSIYDYTTTVLYNTIMYFITCNPNYSPSGAQYTQRKYRNLKEVSIEHQQKNYHLENLWSGCMAIRNPIWSIGKHNPFKTCNSSIGILWFFVLLESFWFILLD